MITEVVKTRDGNISYHGNGTKSHQSEYYGLSTDAKPTAGVENADLFYEMDTQKVFMFDYVNKTWLEQNA